MVVPIRLGLTGGIGSGKSTVARWLARSGATIVDADALSRSLTARDGQAMPEIEFEFGTEMVNADGAMDRVKMRALVFTDADARKRLEAIIHPWVSKLTAQRAQSAAIGGCPCIVFDIPLLVESGRWRQQLDHVLVIDCPSDVQIQRVMARSRLSRNIVDSILASQARREQRLKAADSVVFNGDISLDTLTTQLSHLAPRFGLSSTVGLAEFSA